jgi:sporulation protein YlmC with PRC-barrel domain
MKADFSRGFKIESDDGTVGATRIYDSTGTAVGMVQRFELILDVRDSSLAQIVLEFPAGTDTLLEKKTLEDLYLPGKKKIESET